MGIVSGSIKSPTDGIQTGIIPGNTPIIPTQAAPVNQTSTSEQASKVVTKPKRYDGGISTIATNGVILPRVAGAVKVICPAIWASEPYRGGNGRPRIDVAFQCSVGEIDGIIRIEAGEEQFPIYTFDGGITQNAIGFNRWMKDVEIFVGSEDQAQSSIIKKYLGDDTPYYPGLAYFVIKGLKLWKWADKKTPVMRAVLLNNFSDYVKVEYEYNNYEKAGFPVSSIAGIPGEDYVYVSFQGDNVSKVELSTNTWTSIGTAGNASKYPHSLHFVGENLYLANYQGIYKYSGTGTTWDEVLLTNNTNLYCYGSDDTKFVTVTNNYPTGYNTPRMYDGSTFEVGNGFTGTDPKNCTGVGVSSTGKMWVRMYKTIIDSIISYWDGVSWTGYPIVMNASGTYTKIIEFNGEMWTTVHDSTGDDNYKILKFEEGTGLVGTEDTGLNEASPSAFDIESFGGKVYILKNKPGDAKLYRRDSEGVYTETTPIVGTYTQFYVLKRIGTRLYLGHNHGFMQVGE